jgi:hypothetical protein
MAPRKEPARGHVDIALDLSADVVDAGAEMTLRARVSCAPSGDLVGHSLKVKDEAGGDAGVLALTELDDDENASGTVTLKAPVKTGDYVWSVVSPAVVKDGVSYVEASEAISFSVKPHTTRVLAWDIPSTVVAGDKFKIKVGIKCSSECKFADKAFAIYDHEGVETASGILSGDISPGTSGLYFATVELKAPSSADLYQWSVRSTGKDLERPHAEGAAEFSLRVVSRPECLVKVEAVDKISREPVAGAQVALHPYRTVTDERGFAEIRVAKGAYALFVAKRKYLTLGLPVEVTAEPSWTSNPKSNATDIRIHFRTILRKLRLRSSRFLP